MEVFSFQILTTNRPMTVEWISSTLRTRALTHKVHLHLPHPSTTMTKTAEVQRNRRSRLPFRRHQTSRHYWTDSNKFPRRSLPLTLRVARIREVLSLPEAEQHRSVVARRKRKESLSHKVDERLSFTNIRDPAEVRVCRHHPYLVPHPISSRRLSPRAASLPHKKHQAVILSSYNSRSCCFSCSGKFLRRRVLILRAEVDHEAKAACFRQQTVLCRCPHLHHRGSRVSVTSCRHHPPQQHPNLVESNSVNPKPCTRAISYTTTSPASNSQPTPILPTPSLNNISPAPPPPPIPKLSLTLQCAQAKHLFLPLRVPFPSSWQRTLTQTPFPLRHKRPASQSRLCRLDQLPDQ